MMHIYAFGSVCRGELDVDSDIDLLALVSGESLQLDKAKFSIYSYDRISSLWLGGSPFAWHLYTESKLLFASDDIDFLRTLGPPERYMRFVDDCEKFLEVYATAFSSLRDTTGSEIFDLSSMFLAIRNIATCFSLGVLNDPRFSRHAGKQLTGFPLPLSISAYKILERARILCTRGIGSTIGSTEIEEILGEGEAVVSWMQDLVLRARAYE